MDMDPLGLDVLPGSDSLLLEALALSQAELLALSHQEARDHVVEHGVAGSAC